MEIFMKILVVNDDGIGAEGIISLAQMAVQLGEVWVVAPDHQCSAMSQRITVHGDILVKAAEFPVKGVKAYSISGTPADCIKVAIGYLMPEKPDMVLSGINFGYNIGFDIAYSGTVGAAMEALLEGIPAIAFSNEDNGICEVAEKYLFPVTKELLKREISGAEIWNVNFPGCTMAEFQGIRNNQEVGQSRFYLDAYKKQEWEDGSFSLTPYGISNTAVQAGTDIHAVLEHCISIGKIRSNFIQL